MLLAGSFSEYPLFLLLEILLHKRETGLLEVLSPSESGHFYFKNGEIKDGELGKLRGVEAIKLAQTLEEGSFRFKALEPAEYARLVWETNFGGPHAGLGHPAHSQLQSLHSSLRQSLIHESTAYSSFRRAVGSMAWQVHSYLAVVYRDLEKAAVLTAGRIHSYAAAAYGDLEKAAVLTAGRTHSYAAAAYSNLEKAAVLTAGRTPSYSAVTGELSERAEATRKWLSVLWQTVREALQAAARGRLTLIRNGIISRSSPKVRLERALVLIRKKAAMFPPLFQKVGWKQIALGIVTATILIATVVTISQIALRDQDRVAPAAISANSSNGYQKRSIKASAKRAKTHGRALAQKIVANDKKENEQLSRQTSSEADGHADVTAKSSLLRREKDTLNGQGASEASSDSDVSKRQATNRPGVKTIPIVLQIENGRVSRASVLNHRAGMEAYEAAALQIARQRRFPSETKQTKTVIVKVNQRPD